MIQLWADYQWYWQCISIRRLECTPGLGSQVVNEVQPFQVPSPTYHKQLQTHHCHILDTWSTLGTNTKYLEVIIYSKQVINNHVDAITMKDNSTRGFLNRYLKSCRRKIKAPSYTTDVRPTLVYTAAWDVIRKGTALSLSRSRETRLAVCRETMYNRTN